MKLQVYLLLLTLILAPFASAQFTSGSITGTVVDPQGAAIPQAPVNLVNKQTGFALAATTDASGRFVFPTVPPGVYDLVIKSPGFKTLERSNLTLQVNERLTLGDITLSVGEVTEVVEVSAQAMTLKTESAERANVIASAQMENIAVNGRSYLALAGLTAGVVSTGNFQVAGTAGLAAISANGARSNQNQLLLNGISNVDTGNNGDQLATISLDSVQEFRILTGVYQAEYGRSAGAQIIVQTKSGTKDFHGTGYWYRRHESMNANSWIRNRDGLPRQLYRYQYPGYTIGGPVYIPKLFNQNREKLFFFWSQEFQRQLQPEGQRFVTVPTELERNGDFSQSLDRNGQPLPGIKDPLTGQLFPNAIVPASRFYAPGRALLNFFPTPNRDQRVFRDHNFQTQISTQRPRREDLIRVDYNATDNLRFWGHFINNNNIFTSPYGSFVLGSNLGILDINDGRPGKSYGTGFAWVISPVMTTDFTFGFGRNDILIEPANNSDALTRARTGINLPLLYPSAVQRDFIPAFNFNGTRVTNSPTFGTNNAPFVNYNDTSDFVSNTTRIFSRHTLKFGGYVQFSRKDQTSFAAANGSYNWGDNPNNPFDTNFGYSNALLGVYNNFTQAGAYANGMYRYNNVEWYFQDTWKVTRRLTFDFGVRFAWIQPQFDRSRQVSSFRPELFNPARAVRLYQNANIGGSAVAFDPVTGEIQPSFAVGRLVPNSGDLLNGIVRPDREVNKYLMEDNGIHWGPRFGMAWDIFGDQKTVFRLGGGIFYDRYQGNRVFDLLRNPPTVVEATLNFGRAADINPASALIGPPGLTMADPTGVVPRVYNFSAGIQREVFGGTILDISYVGSMGRNLQNNRNINAVPYGILFDPNFANVPNADFVRPYRGYGNINVYEGALTSNYNSLQVTASRRLRDLTFDFNYTFSKALGTGTGDGDFARIDNLQRFMNYTYLGIHRKHNLNLNYIYEIPNFARNASPVLSAIVGGWQFSGIYSYTSGAPEGVGFSVPGLGNPQFTGSFTEGARVRVIGDPTQGIERNNRNAYLNPQAFAPPQPGSIGTESSPRFVFRPGLSNWNISLQRSVRVREGMVMQFRLDTFNTFNGAQISDFNRTIAFQSLANPRVTNFDPTRPGGFGAANSVHSPRVLQTMIRFQF